MIHRFLLLIIACLFYSPITNAAASCTFSSAPGSILVDFTSNNTTAYLSGQTTTLDGTGALNLTCSGFTIPTTVSYSITISTGSSGNYINRTMLLASSNIQYNLYTDAARTFVWGDGVTASTSKVSGLCATAPCTINLTVYGRVKASQMVPAGNYSDTIIVAINY